MFSNPPMNNPAMIAPGIEPRPPITVTIRPLTVIGTVITGERMPTAAAVMAPAMPPTTPAMAKVIEFVL